MKRILISIALASLSLSTSQAIITMNINTTDETISFSGSDTGNALDDDMMDEYYLRFWINPDQGTVTSNEDINLSGLLNPNEGYLIFKSYYGGTGGANYIDISGSSFSGDMTTLTAVPSASASYADWAPDHKTQLESFIGGSMVLLDGTGYSPIQIAAVPEPSAYAGILGCIGLTLALMRRKRLA